MSAAALSIAFTAGLLSFLSPCIVPMLSVYFSLITGQSFRSLREMTAGDAIHRGVLKNTLAFTLGFSMIFTAAGAAAAQVGSLFQRSLGFLNIIGGIFVIVLGLVALGVVPTGLVQRLTLRHRELQQAPAASRTWSAFLVGLFFALACSHCIAPTLYSVLLYAGGSGSAMAGASLMAAFSLGLSIPYILSGLFLGRMVGFLRKARAPQVWAPRIAGVLMVGLGLLMLFGKLTWLTALLSRVWPFRPPVGM